MSALLQRGRHSHPLLRALIGAAMAVGGGATFIVLALAANAVTPDLAQLSLTLGLAGLPLLSGVAQVVMLMGAALVWAALRRR